MSDQGFEQRFGKGDRVMNGGDNNWLVQIDCCVGFCCSVEGLFRSSPSEKNECFAAVHRLLYC